MFTRLIPLFLVFAFSNGVFAEDAPAWKLDEALDAAASFLSPDTKRKTFQKQSKAWLDKLESSNLNLGEYAYMKSVVLARRGESAAAQQALSDALDGQSKLPLHAAAHGKVLSRVGGALLNANLKEGSFARLPALVRTLLDIGTQTPDQLTRQLSRRLAKADDPDLRVARAEIAGMIAEHVGLSYAEKDVFMGRLYGKGGPLPEMTDPEAHALIAGRDIDRARFLVLGGGGSYRNNQISLERNVEFLHRLQEEKGFDPSGNHILFADGTSDGKDLQLVNPDDVPELNGLLASILGTTSGLNLSYRSHHLDHVAGATTQDNIQQFLDELKLESDEQLMINFTGHGGHGEKENAQNTSLYLWENKTIRVKDFCKMLDKLPVDNPVMVLMVQCYSGGFANLIFKEGNPDKGLVDHPRCGFFATVHDRIAAGCTPSIDEEAYYEYTSYFMTALGGKTRTGTPIDLPDYDGDGKVCFAEAHAYALIESETLDVSIKTSDVFLRKYSRLASDDDLLSIRSYRRLLAQAGPCEKAVLEGLSKRIGLSGDRRVEGAQVIAAEVAKRRKSAGDAKSKASREVGELRKELSGAIRAQWPELANPWHPRVFEILSKEKKPLIKLIKDHPKYDAFLELRKTYRAHQDQFYVYDEAWACLQRFIRTAENVAYEVNLPKVANEDIQKRYTKLVELERGTLEAKPRETTQN
ncbi:MAG: hypothetical protein ACI9TH_003784 [Kiritimatiellia bacterium]|jgi:hypothetical protein